jgi:hypothetical protein
VILVLSVALLFVGCDKKGVDMEGRKEVPIAKASFGDIPPPPPVVKIPDATPWLDPDVAVFESDDPDPDPDAGPGSDLKSVVHAQAVFVEAKSKKLDDLHEEVKEAERLIKAKFKKRRDFDTWRKRHGKKIPTMKTLKDLEQSSPKWKIKRAKSKGEAYPRFRLEGDG